jgi:flavin reductase (DIM6/NTAB) family NADH-FMN oxidoreductase RutF
MHRSIEPAILYVGTPVVLVSSINPDGSANLAPISSLWFLGWTALLGFDASSQTPRNIQRSGECVLNLPSADLVASVDRLALLTGRSNVPLHKRTLGYRYERDKFDGRGPRLHVSRLARAPELRYAPPSVQIAAAMRAAFTRR